MDYLTPAFASMIDVKLIMKKNVKWSSALTKNYTPSTPIVSKVVLSYIAVDEDVNKLNNPSR